MSHSVRRSTPFSRAVSRSLVASALSLLLLAPWSAERAQAADDGIMAPGDAAVTQFSGTRQDKKVPKDVHPLDVTTIDQEGVALTVIDLAKPGVAGDGQLFQSNSKLAIKAGEIGQVFGVALDSSTADRPPNIYAAASSLYGLQIVGERDGETVRLVKGEPGARWMPGQFGLDSGGGPGSIWKIDGQSGKVSLFSTITTGNTENAGPGLGGLAFDTLTQQLYATSLETGLIHRLDLSGRELSTFDHGRDGRTKAGLGAVAFAEGKRMDIQSPSFSVEDPATWGYADPRRLAVALAIHKDRLYYSVAEGPVVWSVGLASDGSFLTDPQLEIDVTGTPNNNPITAIGFDGDGRMYLSQRGEKTGTYDFATFARPQASSVLRYRWDDKDKSWTEAPEEYAIGEEPVHRATNGGLALGYGYNDKGEINRGQCRQTVWTTGEHLVPGDSKKQPVHGLQGMPIGAAQPAVSSQPKSGSAALQGKSGESEAASLDPPKTALYTDADEDIVAENGHGYTGAIAIYTACDPAEGAPRDVATRVTPLWPPDQLTIPPRPVPGIYVAKECFPGLVGGPIRCRISVTNTGIEPTAPINLTDVSTVLSGPGAGGPVTILSSTPDAPGWFCTPTPTAAFQCVLPSGILLPGLTRFVDVMVDTGPIVAAGNAAFRNCASLGAPYSATVCADGATGTIGGLVIQKTGQAQCNPGTNCTFALAINNTGSQPFAGNIQISDAMFVAGASVPAPIVASSLNCIGGNPAALPFTCVVPGNIPPASAQTYSITVTMPAAPPNYWAENCFAAFDPTLAPPGGPLPSPGGPGGPGVGSPTNPACHWVAAGNPPPQSNLIISKTPVGGVCDSSIPSGVASCRYQIRIKNDGPSPFNNIISINEVTPVGSNLLLAPNWPCVAAAPGFTCSSPAPVSLAPGASLIIQATIQIPALLTEPTCTVPNTVSIAAPLGGPSNVQAGDDAAPAAIHNTALIAVLNPDGTVSVACDPTNLATTKTVESCTSSGSSTDCTYKVTVTNMGPDPYQGPITVEDTLSAAPSSISFTGDWACGGAGTGYLCTKPGVSLAAPGKPGEHSVSFKVKVSVPNAPGQCVLHNRAHMSFPLSGTRFNQSGADDTSAVSTPVASPECQRKPQCESPSAGEQRSISGACVCKSGLLRSKDGTCDALDDKEPERATPEAATCPDGNPIPRSGVCPCKSGETWNRDTASCDAACEPGPNEYRTSAGQCVCKSGYDRRDGRCVVGDDSGPPVTVPPVNIPPVRSSPQCDPGPNEYRSAKGNCYCVEGTYRDDAGRCVREPDRCELGPHEVRNSRGDCVCEYGYERLDGRCRRYEQRCVPGPNEYRKRNGDCVCERGYERNSRGVCEPVIVLCDPGPNEYRNWKNQCLCRRGFDRDDRGRCVPEVIDCGPRRHMEDGVCVPDRYETGCEDGWHWDRRRDRCVPDDDARGEERDCIRRGWIWTGKVCIAPPKDPRDECRERGGRWNDGRCVVGPSEADLCRKRGGEWNGKRCIMEEKQCPPGTSGNYPNCKKDEAKVCPEGTSGKYPNCRKDEPKVCPEGTSGKYPNCKKDEPKVCPEGTSGKYPNCKKDEPKVCPEGTSGKYPNCKKDEPKVCPEGTSGKYPNCKKDPPKVCPEGTSGKYPNCKKDPPKVCPEGTSGKYPNCKKDPPKVCPPGSTGKYPNCKAYSPKPCPPGTVGKFPNCEKVKPADKPKPKPNDKPTPPPTCPKGQIMFQGKCVTPS